MTPLILFIVACGSYVVLLVGNLFLTRLFIHAGISWRIRHDAIPVLMAIAFLTTALLLEASGKTGSADDFAILAYFALTIEVAVLLADSIRRPRRPTLREDRRGKDKTPDKSGHD